MVVVRVVCLFLVNSDSLEEALESNKLGYKFQLFLLFVLGRLIQFFELHFLQQKRCTSAPQVEGPPQGPGMSTNQVFVLGEHLSNPLRSL